MATNYTITGNGTNADGEFTFGFVETIGDSVGAGNMITSAPLTITPDEYYVVQASDFSIGDALPSDVTSVVFTDTGTPNQPGNTVLATVNFASGFTVTALKVVTVDIDGAATFIGTANDLSVEVEEQINFEFEAIALGLAAGSGVTINETTPSSGLKLINFSGQATPNKSKSLGTITITADSGFYFNSVPYFEYYNKQKEELQLVKKTVTRDSDNRRTAYSFDLIFKSAVDTSTVSGSRVKLIANTIAIPQETKQITKVSFGEPQVSPSGQERIITVYGTKDAEFNLTITDNTDKKSILDTTTTYGGGTTLTTVLNPVYGSIDAINKKFSTGLRTGRQCSFVQKFPQYSSTIRTTAVNMGGGLSGTTATFDSLTDVRVGDRLKMDVISTGDTVTVTALNSSTEAVLSQSVTADDDAVAIFTRDQKYFINLFPLNDTILGVNIPTEEPHYTIHQYMDPVLKLTVSETDGGYTGPTTVYTKNGRANAFPEDISDRQIYEEGTSASYFPISYSITSDGGKRIAAVGATGGVPTWSSTDASASMWTNSVSANNGGTEIEIVNIKMAGLPTSTPGTCTLTADVIVIKWGTEDVTMNLDLDQIITTS